MKEIFVYCIVLLLMSCSKSPCDDTDCLAGRCVDGTCFCPERYSGEFCQNEVQPSSIQIDAVRVLSFPEFKTDGSFWDLGEDPEAYPDIKMGISNGKLLWQSELTFNNVQEGDLTNFAVNPTFLIHDVKDEVQFILWDNDFLELEFMASLERVLYQNGQDFPRRIALENGDFKIEVDLSYHW